MKKTLSLLCAACIAVGMQAQTYMVNDFESGLNGANDCMGRYSRVNRQSLFVER